MTHAMRMTRSQRAYTAIITRNSKPWAKDDGAFWDGTRMVRCMRSKHLTRDAQLARRLRALVSMARWS